VAYRRVGERARTSNRKLGRKSRLAPPVGNLRWQPPKDHAPWTNALKTTEFAPICALITTLGVFSGAPNDNEDCLYLNVFTPDPIRRRGFR
jgi:carboxylesterase type B